MKSVVRTFKLVYLWTLFLTLWLFTALAYVPFTSLLAMVLALIGYIFNGEVRHTYQNILSEMSITTPREVYSLNALRLANEKIKERLEDE